MTALDSPIPLSELESVLAWVDSFKLSRPTKKINRDFSDAVLLAEMLNVHYPKLVEMHNYPPRNSHALKLNNWMTLNRKVLKKLKLNLCCNTMEQLANAAPGLIERVLIMVREKIRRDEELNRSVKDAEQNVSSGGSYYEACGDDEHVLVVPVKTRVNGVLETVQQKVVNYESYLALKEELKDAKDTTELLKQKVEHLDSLIKLKDERIDELQKQLDRKQTRRKEAEAFQNSLAVPFETVQSPVVADILPLSRKSSLKSVEPTKTESLTKTAINEPTTKIPVFEPTTKIPVSEPFNKILAPEPFTKILTTEPIIKIPIAEPFSKIPVAEPIAKIIVPEIVNKEPRSEESKIPVPKIQTAVIKPQSKPSITEVSSKDMIRNEMNNVERIRSDVFKEIEIVDMENHVLDRGPQNNNENHVTVYPVQNAKKDKECDDDSLDIDLQDEAGLPNGTQDLEEFKDSEPGGVVTIEESIQKEITEIVNPRVIHSDLNYVI